MRGAAPAADRRASQIDALPSIRRIARSGHAPRGCERVNRARHPLAWPGEKRIPSPPGGGSQRRSTEGVRSEPTRTATMAPNWGDDTAYPANFEDWTLGQWVWAFLRRNSDYQNDYAKFAALPAFWPEGGKTPKWSGRSVGDDDDMGFRYSDPPALPGETSRNYWRRNHGKVIAEMALEERLMDEWGIIHLPDPADENGFRILGLLFEIPPYVLHIEGPDVSGICSAAARSRRGSPCNHAVRSAP